MSNTALSKMKSAGTAATVSSTSENTQVNGISSEEEKQALEEKRFFDMIEKVIPGDYTPRAFELAALYNKNHGDDWSMIWDAFRFGFLKGQRALKTEMKKKEIAK